MTSEHPSRDRLSQNEFIALIAMLFATIAFSIDALLPAEPAIAAAFTPDAPNRAKMVIGAFFLGMGLGTFVSGPLSDTFGRKRVIMWGAIIYCLASLAGWLAQSLEVLLIARVVQGFGAAGPRTVSLAMVRDLYKGREMARIMSFAMMIFMVAPAAAPLIGQQIINLAGWHAIFLVFVLFSVIAMLWLGLRQPETLPVEERKPLNIGMLLQSGRELFSHRVVVVSVLIQAMTMAILVATISSVQTVFAMEFDMEQSFPTWFALAAILSAGASLVNARIVMTLGMRRVATLAYAGTLAFTLLHLVLLTTGVLGEAVKFAIFFVWLVSLFCMMGLTMGNLNALAMEPVGHIAGFAASIMAAVATVISVALSWPITQAFYGTHLPLVIGTVVLSAASLAMMRLLRQKS